MYNFLPGEYEMNPRCIFAILLLFGLGGTEASGQISGMMCDRPTIESYPANESAPLLQHLDEARQVADEVIQLFVEGNFDELSNKMRQKTPKMWIRHLPGPHKEPFQIEFAAFRQTYGNITHYEYRNQGIDYSYGDTEVDLTSTVTTFFAITTTKSTTNDLFLVVETVRPEKNVHVPRALDVEDWDQKKAPEFLVNPAAAQRRTCDRFMQTLRIRAPRP
jgi:hypothetical protein